MKNLLIVGIVVVLLAVGTYFYLTNRLTQPATQQDSSGSSTSNFATPKKSAHYESNTPAHGTTLAGVPVNVVIDFNFDLAEPSEIKILKDGKDYGAGETVIDSSKLAMRRRMEPNTPNGIYAVEYKACWPDGSCHDGNFQFAIDKTQAASFDDQTDKQEVTIKLSQIQFNPQNIKINKGTNVIWVNDDSVEHFINTNSHPAHTYYPAQNSRALKKGDQFSLTFDQSGIYPYHCSAHAASMMGSLLVQ